MVRGLRGRLVLAVTAAVAAASLGVAPAALAGDTDEGTIGPINYRSTSATASSSGGGGTPGIECSPGSRPVGGGVRISGDWGDSLINGSQPGTQSAFGLRRWAIGWLTFSGGKTYGTSAACMDVERKLVIDGGLIDGESTKVVKAKCPAGTHVSGGGGTGAGHLNSSYPYDSGDPGRKPDDGWKARIHYPGPEDDFFTVRAFALCVEFNPRYLESDPVSISGGAVSAELHCHPDHHIVGGGLKLGGDASDAGLLRATLEDAPSDPDAVPDDRLLATAGEAGGPVRPMRMFAICRT